MIQQIPWFDRKFNFDFPVTLFPVIFSRLEGTVFRLHTLLMNADDEQCSISTNGWSVKEHIGHLYDLEDLWMKRLGDFIQNSPTLTVADLNNTKTKTANHNDKTVEQLLQQFTVERQQTLEYIYPFDEAGLEKVSVHPRLKQEMRLIDSLLFVAEHDDHHVAVISTILRKG